MRCPSCGFDADPAHRVCAHCGTPLPGTPVPPWGGSPYPNPQQSIAPGGWPASGYQILEPGVAPGSRRPVWIWLVAVLAVIFVSAAAAGVILKLVHKVPKPSAPPPRASASAPDGRAQANAIDALLNASSASRTQLGPALQQVENCGDLNAATATLQQVVTQRDDQVRRGQSLAVDQLTGGEQLRTLLVQALTHSLQADQKFVAWAQNTTTNGCTGHAAHDSEYAAAQTASSGATTSKQSFVQLWNPIATRYGLSTRSESSF